MRRRCHSGPSLSFSVSEKGICASRDGIVDLAGFYEPHGVFVCIPQRRGIRASSFKQGGSNSSQELCRTSTPRSDVISWQGNLEETQEETKVSSATNGFINSYSRDLTKPSLDHPAAPSGK